MVLRLRIADGRREGKWDARDGGGGFDTRAKKDVSAKRAVEQNLGLEMIELRKKLKNKLQQYGPHLMGAFVLVLLVHNIFGTHGFLAMRQKQKEIRKISAELEKLNKENAALEQEMQDVKSDPETIKKIAHEEYGLAGPNEIIIKMPPAPKAAVAPGVRP
jgi:cell division protein FtsL